MRYWVVKRDAAYYCGKASRLDCWWLHKQRLAKRYTSKVCAERRADIVRGRIVTVVRAA